MAKDFSWKILFWITLTLVSCMVNVVFLEKIIGNSKSSSNLITFLCFLLLSIDGFIFTSKGFTKKPAVPIKYNATIVIIFFLTNVGNNLVFRFNIPMTLHMIFKSGSLLTSLVLGVVLLKRRYTLTKYISVIAITIGIILCTYASTKQTPKSEDSSDSSFHFGEFVIGITLLSSTLVASSYLGVLQERLAEKFGKHPRESLFYNHVLPLPFFAFLYKDLVEQVTIVNNSDLMEVPLLGVTIPHMWFLLACNTLFQYICINSVFQLTTECTSLTVTLVITVRKFLSLLISIFYFGNTFTALHWVGAILVFSGSAMFADLHKMLIGSGQSLKKVQ